MTPTPSARQEAEQVVDAWIRETPQGDPDSRLLKNRVATALLAAEQRGRGEMWEALEKHHAEMPVRAFDDRCLCCGLDVALRGEETEQAC